MARYATLTCEAYTKGSTFILLQMKQMVGKIFKPEFDKDGAIRRMCFQEARIDMKSKHWAGEFNKKDTPENVCIRTKDFRLTWSR